MHPNVDPNIDKDAVLDRTRRALDVESRRYDVDGRRAAFATGSWHRANSEKGVNSGDPHG